LLVLGASGAGTRFPIPEHTPCAEASKVARWLAAKTAAGTPAGLDAPVSSAVRVCLVAQRDGLDISGTFFRVGGEPLTRGKLEVIRATGATAAAIYSMSEVGMVGIACADGCCADDVHLLEDKLASIERAVQLGGASVPALFLTTLSGDCPKLMLNVETGDSAVSEARDCCCPFGMAGFRRHLHSIHSYEKLCTEGMCFLGTELTRLLEEILPAEFGGHVGDYQMVETEEGGITRIEVVVAPLLGAVDEEAIVQRCLDVLSRVPGGEVMTGVWADARTLCVVRRDVRPGLSGKILPLMVCRQA
jgi:phenylacetate-coenzyme A ligase PaaK-like adenylate-forming protein